MYNNSRITWTLFYNSPRLVFWSEFPFFRKWFRAPRSWTLKWPILWHCCHLLGPYYHLHPSCGMRRKSGKEAYLHPKSLGPEMEHIISMYVPLSRTCHTGTPNQEMYCICVQREKRKVILRKCNSLCHKESTDQEKIQ